MAYGDDVAWYDYIRRAAVPLLPAMSVPLRCFFKVQHIAPAYDRRQHLGVRLMTSTAPRGVRDFTPLVTFIGPKEHE